MNFVDRLGINVEGRYTDNIPVASFLKLVDNAFRILKALDARQTLIWRIEGLSMRSPIDVGIGGEAAVSSVEVDNDVSDLYADLFDNLNRNYDPSPRVPRDAVKIAGELVNVLSDGVARVSFTSRHGRVVTPNYQAVKSSVHRILADNLSDHYYEPTTVEGVLKAYSVVKGREISVYDRLTNKPIVCQLEDEKMFADLVSSSNLDRRMSVEGKVHFYKGVAKSISVESYEFLPSLSQFSDGPSGLEIDGDSVEYIRRLRGDGE